MKTIRIACDVKDHLDLDSLTPFQGELKTLSKQNYAKLKKEILTTGFAFPFFIWKDKKGKYFIIGGHQRLECLRTMREEGYTIPKVPVVFIEAGSIVEAKRRVIQDVGQYGKVSKQGLYDFMHDAELTISDISTSFAIPDMEMNMDKFRHEFFETDDAKSSAIDDVVPSVPKTPKTKPGNLFRLGKHRLLCGDSTNDDDVQKLMDGVRADITFTSPPYNLGTNAKLRGSNASGKDSAYEEKSDHKSQEQYLEFLKKFTNLAMKHTQNVFCNIQMLAGNKLIMSEYWNHFRDNLIDIMIWDKEHGAPAMAPQVLNSAWEFIFIFTDEHQPKRSIKTGKEFRGNIPNIYRLNPMGKKDPLAKDHGAVFPVQFAEYFIDKFSMNSVLDLFGGSGTTMIAAEKLGRTAFLMEMSPSYCDVIIERFEKFTGQKAVKIK